MSTGTLKNRFAALGYAGPIPLFDPQECLRLLCRLQLCGEPSTWYKGHAAAWHAYYEAGSNRAIVDVAAELLGEDVLLWGATLVRREPGQMHPWHTDVETSSPTARTVTVWLGLANTNRHSALQLVASSHRFGITMQERASVEGKERSELTNEDVLRWAMEYDPHSRAEHFDMGDGQAVFFDGRLWHGSNNASDRTRVALLLQYATPDTPIRIPASGGYSWPFRFLETPRPPCIMVRGSAHETTNHVVPPPAKDPAGVPSSSWIKTLDLPLAEDAKKGWKGYPIFRGATAIMPRLSCHASVLSAGRMPHEVHRHLDEELLIMLAGSAELVIEEPDRSAELVIDDSNRNATRTVPVERNSFVYYPAYQGHTIRNNGSEPAAYLMFKWSADPVMESEAPLDTRLVDVRHHLNEVPVDERSVGARGNAAGPFAAKRVFEAPTKYLTNLHSHVTVLQPGGGYDAHADAYDVAIVTLEGTVETLGRRVGPNSVIFYAAGEPHGMKNVGDVPAVYVVFEFHGTPGVRRARHRSRKALPARVWRRVRRLARRVRNLRLPIVRLSGR